MSNKSQKQSNREGMLMRAQEIIPKKLESDLKNSEFWNRYELLLNNLITSRKFSAEKRDFEKEFEEIRNRVYKINIEDSSSSMVAEDPVEYFTSRYFRYSFYDLYPQALPEQRAIIIDETKRIKKIL